MSASDRPILPPATIGMLGGGQLGKYALAAANAMGYRTLVVDPDPEAPAAVIANLHIVSGYDEPEAVAQVAASCSVVTTEFENAPATALARLAQDLTVAPAAASVAVAQDRIVEKTFMVDHDIAVGPFVAAPVDLDTHQRRRAHELAATGAVVKTARFGYDGKGQRRVATPTELDAALVAFAGNDCIVEALLDLSVEVSVVLARTTEGDVEHWDVTENVHVDGILDISVAPARISDRLAARAITLATSVAEHLDYVGVLAVEFFVSRRRTAGQRDRTAAAQQRPLHHRCLVSPASSNSRSRALCGLRSVTRA